MMDWTNTVGPKQTTEVQLREVTIGELEPLAGQIAVATYDPAQPQLFALEEARIRAVHGDRAVRIEHVGSSSVPGLAAKPKIDVLLAVADSSAELDYVPALETAGYVLRVREPVWFEHRLLRGPDTDLNLHVFSHGCLEIGRMLRFRDHLRSNAADRLLYERTKSDLASRSWAYLRHYAGAKTAVVEQILGRADGVKHDDSASPEIASIANRSEPDEHTGV